MYLPETVYSTPILVRYARKSMNDFALKLEQNISSKSLQI
jgi:hypothetical protein